MKIIENYSICGFRRLKKKQIILEKIYLIFANRPNLDNTFCYDLVIQRKNINGFFWCSSRFIFTKFIFRFYEQTAKKTWCCSNCQGFFIIKFFWLRLSFLNRFYITGSAKDWPPVQIKVLLTAYILLSLWWISMGFRQARISVHNMR